MISTKFRAPQIIQLPIKPRKANQTLQNMRYAKLRQKPLGQQPQPEPESMSHGDRACRRLIRCYFAWAVPVPAQSGII